MGPLLCSALAPEHPTGRYAQPSPSLLAARLPETYMGNSEGGREALGARDGGTREPPRLPCGSDAEG